jgi:hypothetical protein
VVVAVVAVFDPDAVVELLDEEPLSGSSLPHAARTVAARAATSAMSGFRLLTMPRP